jgi:hypothetical protein
MAEQFEKDRKLYLESFPGIKCFQTFDDVKDRKSRKLIWQASTDADHYPIDGEIDYTKKIIPLKIISDMEARNKYRACCSLGINETNGKGRKREDIVRIRSVFGDFDDVPLPKSWDIEPSMIVNTSPGKYHVYFFTVLDDEKYATPLQGYPILQESIVYKYKTDPSMKDITKALRIPGFYHQKKEPYLVNIVEYTGKRYSFGELVEAFPPKPRKVWSSERYKKVREANPNSEFRGVYGANKGYRNCHIMARVGGMIKRRLSWNMIEIEVYKEAENCNPPLKDFQVKAILKSAKRYY